MSGGSLSKPCNSPGSEQMGRGLCRCLAAGRWGGPVLDHVSVSSRRSSRAPARRVRAFSKPYGKRGAQSNHVAAEPRPGGNVRNALRGHALLRSQDPGSRGARPWLPTLPNPTAPPVPAGPPGTRGSRSSPAQTSPLAGSGDRARRIGLLVLRKPRTPQRVQTRGRCHQSRRHEARGPKSRGVGRWVCHPSPCTWIRISFPFSLLASVWSPRTRRFPIIKKRAVPPGHSPPPTLKAKAKDGIALAFGHSKGTKSRHEDVVTSQHSLGESAGMGRE